MVTPNLKSELSLLAGRRVMVTGSTGFKGSWSCAWLVDLGAEVSGFALPAKEDAPLFGQFGLENRISQHYGDIRKLEDVMRAFDAAKPEVVIHLAAQALVRLSYAEPKETFDTNVGGAVNLLEAVRATDSVRSLVFITSDKCYRNKEWVWGYRENDELGGSDPYSASKAAAELVFRSYADSYFAHRDGFRAVTARAGNVIGGGDWSADRIVPDAIRALKQDIPIVVRNPDATRPWQHVLEPLSGYLRLASALLAGRDDVDGAWNFGPDAENVRPVSELVTRIIDAWGNGTMDVRRENTAMHEARLLMLSSDKAKSALDWRPHWAFEDAVDKTVEWYRAVEDGADPLQTAHAQIAEYLKVRS